MRALVLAGALLLSALAPAQDGAVVLLDPARLAPARGVEISRLSLMVWHDDAETFAPIPFQIDELDEKGMVWFADSDFALAGEADVFDGNDQLLFLQQDAGGGRAPAGAVPAQGELLAEIVVQGDDDTRYVYLMADHPARSSARYIEHDPDKGVSRTPWYILTTDIDNELNWQYLGYRGYTGPPDDSIIDTLKMRMSGGVLVPYPRITLDNGNLRPRLRGFRIGPIRSVMHLETGVVFAGLPVMRLHMQAHRFPNHYEAHSYARIPGLYRKAVRNPRVSVSVDGNRLTGARTWTAAGGNALHGTVDGRMDEMERELVKRPLSTDHSWILFDTGNAFALLAQLVIPPELEGIPLELVYQDDADLHVKPEQHPGQYPNLGYAMNGWPRQDELRFAVRLLFFSGLDGSAEEVAARRASRDVAVSVRPPRS